MAHLVDHVRASAGSRAANVVSISAFRPAAAAFSVPRTTAHHSAGILFLCHHLETAGAPAPTSEAIASLEGHNSITSRKVRMSIQGVLGQIVLKRKDNLALDTKFSLGHTVRMAESETEAQFKQAFISRVKAARIATGLKQWQLANAIGVPQDHYKHWEKTRLLPHHLIGRFCVVCRVDPVWLMTGHGEKPLKAPHVVEPEQAPIPSLKRNKRSRAA